MLKSFRELLTYMVFALPFALLLGLLSYLNPPSSASSPPTFARVPPLVVAPAPPVTTVDVLRMKDKPADPVLVAKEGHLSELAEVRQLGNDHDNYHIISLLMSCEPPAGTPVIVTKRGLLSSTILVIRGDATGCRGDVPNDWLGKAPRPY